MTDTPLLLMTDTPCRGSSPLRAAAQRGKNDTPSPHGPSTSRLPVLSRQFQPALPPLHCVCSPCRPSTAQASQPQRKRPGTSPAPRRPCAARGRRCLCQRRENSEVIETSKAGAAARTCGDGGAEDILVSRALVRHGVGRAGLHAASDVPAQHVTAAAVGWWQ